jgi:deazaflavin-dependent oxidoreductase (nitroreductase family)
MRTSGISEILRAELFDPFLDAAFANNARDAEYLISDKPPTVPEQSHSGPVRWPQTTKNGAAMSRQDHPNNAPGVPMLFPVWFEKFQTKYFNPAVKPIARYLPTFSVIKHRGRASGKQYETIVTAYTKGNVLAIGLAHGKTDWVKNVLAAGEADLHFIRKDVHITNPRVLPAGSDGKGLPFLARQQIGRVAVFVADIA